METLDLNMILERLDNIADAIRREETMDIKQALNDRRTRLIEQYAGECFFKSNDWEDEDEGVKRAVRRATKLADAVIVACEEKASE